MTPSCKYPNPHRFPAPLRRTRSLGLGPFCCRRFAAQGVTAAAAEAGSWAVAGAAVGAELGRSLLRWMAPGSRFGRNPWISHGILEETI